MNSLSAFKNFTDGLKEQEQVLPILFIGHGSPMNGIEDSEFSRPRLAYHDLGKIGIATQNKFSIPAFTKLPLTVVIQGIKFYI